MRCSNSAKRHRPGQLGSVGIHRLAEERQFAIPSTRQIRHLTQDVLGGAAALATSRERYDAEAAIIVATLHDRDPGADRAVPMNTDAGGEEAGGLSGRSDGSPDGGAGQVGNLGQMLAVSHHEVQVREAAQEPLPFPLSETAGHTDLQTSTPGLEGPQRAELAVELLLRLLADTAAVEDDQVGFLLVVGEDVPLLREKAGNPGRVELIGPGTRM